MARAIKIWFKLWWFRFWDAVIRSCKGIKRWFESSDVPFSGATRALNLAARRGQTWKINYLLGEGANPHVPDNRGMTAILYGIDYKCENFIAALTEIETVSFDEQPTGLSISEEQDRISKHPLLRAVIKGKSPELVNAIAKRCNDSAFIRDEVIPIVPEGAYEENRLAPDAVVGLLERRIEKLEREQRDGKPAGVLIEGEFGNEAAAQA